MLIERCFTFIISHFPPIINKLCPYLPPLPNIQKINTEVMAPVTLDTSMFNLKDLTAISA